MRNFFLILLFLLTSCGYQPLFTNKNATSLSGSLTLDGVLSNSNDLDGFVTITSSGDDSSVNFTIKGYDQDGNFQSETIPGGNATSVTGDKIFKSITSTLLLS